MNRSQLSNKVGAGLDPCAAIQVTLELAEGEEREIVFRLGVAGRRGADEANKLVRRFRGAAAARNALEAVRQYWHTALGALQVETPERSLDVLTNGWLLYQTLACRLWARSGYYQSGGAFGFRDQLQDVMALVHAEPVLVREHLLRCAAHQFREGDVQHWWHPSSDRGVRTHCSDDYLWLPLATSRYVLATGDRGVLAETIHFIDGRPVNPHPLAERLDAGRAAPGNLRHSPAQRGRPPARHARHLPWRAPRRGRVHVFARGASCSTCSSGSGSASTSRDVDLLRRHAPQEAFHFAPEAP